jgi:hypothetical protein
MWLTLDDLQCSECGAFVHPLIDSCPECGAGRLSRLGEAAAGPIGAVRLLEAPETQRMAHNITVRYTMKVNAIGGGVADPSLDDAVAHLADALTYRIGGDAVPDTDNAGLTLRDGCLIAQARPSGALLAEIPLPSILAAAAGRGDVTVHYAAPSGTGVAGAPSETPTVATRRRLSVANRRGLLAQRARDAHYEDLSRWLVVLTAAAAERRWMEIGLAAYLAELGSPRSWRYHRRRPSGRPSPPVRPRHPPPRPHRPSAPASWSSRASARPACWPTMSTARSAARSWLASEGPARDRTGVPDCPSLRRAIPAQAGRGVLSPVAPSGSSRTVRRVAPPVAETGTKRNMLWSAAVVYHKMLWFRH